MSVDLLGRSTFNRTNVPTFFERSKHALAARSECIYSNGLEAKLDHGKNDQIQRRYAVLISLSKGQWWAL